jgi:hypothetical protein
VISIQYLFEYVLFSGKDYFYRLKDWEDGKVKILLLFGLSGSGKTSTGLWASKKYKADYINLDKEFFKPIHKEFKDKHGHVAESEEEMLLITKKINVEFKKLLIKIKKKTIIDGLWPLYLNPKELDKYAIVIKGTSILKSSLRRQTRRHKEGKSDPLTHMWNRFWWGNSFNWRVDKRIDLFKKHLDGLKQ